MWGSFDLLSFPGNHMDMQYKVECIIKKATCKKRFNDKDIAGAMYRVCDATH